MPSNICLMRFRRRGLLPYLPLLAACSSGASSPAAVSPAPSEIERVLEHSRIESIVAGRAATFTRRVALMAGDLTDPELERLVPAVRAAFAPEPMRRDVAAFMEAQAPAGMLTDLLAMLESGAHAELTRIRRGYEPPLSLEEYARSMMETPPPDERVRLVVEWTEVQGAAGFYVLMDEALTEAANAVVAVLRPDAPAFEPLAGPELQARLDDSFNGAVVSFLRGLEPVPDEVLRAATEEYAGETGQWYVESYSLGVAEAMRNAGARVVESLRGAAGPVPEPGALSGSGVPSTAAVTARWSGPTSG